MIRSNRAGFALLVGGVDYAAAIAPHLAGDSRRREGQEARFQGLTITEKLEEAADELTLTLLNYDGQLAPIQRGVLVSCSLGWTAGADLPLGLVAKGTFKVDEVTREGPPDKVTIRARSADFTGRFRTRRDRSWKGGTLGDLVRQIATSNGYSARVHPDLSGIAVEAVEQAAKSDAAFIRDLGRRHDAVATVKNGTLLFLPIGASTNAAGESFGTRTLGRRDGSRWRFVAADREEHDGAEAQWHDRQGARKRTATVGSGKNPLRVRRKFASEREAREAAGAAARRAQRGRFEFSYEMALGDPAIEPNQRIRLQGWDSEIDTITWLVEQAEHRLDGSAGLRTSLTMKSLA